MIVRNGEENRFTGPGIPTYGRRLISLAPWRTGDLLGDVAGRDRVE